MLNLIWNKLIKYVCYIIIIKGLLFAKADTIKTVTDLTRLYVHESERVYCDKLVDNDDINLFFKTQKDVLKKSIEVSSKKNTLYFEYFEIF